MEGIGIKSMRVLHAGCGGEPLPPYFGECKEVRLDASPDLNPDVVANIVDMGDIGVFDAVYCSHTLEHVYPHEVVKALREFRRVLKEGGYAMIFVPDLEDVVISEETLYVSPAGPITAMDMIYGHRGLIEQMPYMAHHVGFTSKTLEASIYEAGFSKATMKRMRCYNLMAIAQV